MADGHTNCFPDFDPLPTRSDLVQARPPFNRRMADCLFFKTGARRLVGLQGLFCRRPSDIPRSIFLVPSASSDPHFEQRSKSDKRHGTVHRVHCTAPGLLWNAPFPAPFRSSRVWAMHEGERASGGRCSRRLAPTSNIPFGSAVAWRDAWDCRLRHIRMAVRQNWWATLHKSLHMPGNSGHGPVSGRTTVARNGEVSNKNSCRLADGPKQYPSEDKSAQG